MVVCGITSLMALGSINLEFIGLPGSGKTFIASKLSSELNVKVSKLEKENRAILINYFYYSLVIIKNCFQIYRIMLNSNIFDLKTPYKIKKWRIFLLIRFFILIDRKKRQSKKVTEEIIVLDQGVVQSICSCRMSGLNIDSKIFLKAIEETGMNANKHIVVIHNSKLETAISSVYNRRNQVLPIIKNFDAHEVSNYFQRMQKIFIDIERQLKIVGIKTIHTNRDNKVDESLDILLSQISIIQNDG